jgi:hypothetical protein
MRISLVTIAAALAIASPAQARAIPDLDQVAKPDWSAKLLPQGVATIPSRVCKGKRPSNVHVYNLRGRAYKQHRDPSYPQTYWTRGPALAGGVAGYVPENRDFVSFAYRTTVIVAAWCDR